MTEHSHSGGQQLHKIRRHVDFEPQIIVSQNPLIGCLSSTPEKNPLFAAADREISCSQSPALLEHQTILDNGQKVNSIEVSKFDDSVGKQVFGKSCTYVLLGGLLAACLLGSVGFFVTHLGLADSFGMQESYDKRVLVVKRLMLESPLIG